MFNKKNYFKSLALILGQTSYTGSSGKQEVTLELSYILWKLLTSLHVT